MEICKIVLVQTSRGWNFFYTLFPVTNDVMLVISQWDSVKYTAGAKFTVFWKTSLIRSVNGESSCHRIRESKRVTRERFKVFHKFEIYANARWKIVFRFQQLENFPLLCAYKKYPNKKIMVNFR